MIFCKRKANVNNPITTNNGDREIKHVIKRLIYLNLTKLSFESKVLIRIS